MAKIRINEITRNKRRVFEVCFEPEYVFERFAERFAETCLEIIPLWPG